MSDFSLPSFLMPLVSPYLKYEEAADCMRLNSQFYKYIDNDWKDMPKKEIWIQFEFSGDEVVLNFTERGRQIGFFISSQPGFSGLLIGRHEMEIVSKSKRRPFLDEYLKKRGVTVPSDQSGTYYYTTSRLHGLKLVLEALVQRVSIYRIELSRMRVDQYFSELLIISNCLSSHYKPKSSYSRAEISSTTYSPFLADYAKSLGTTRCNVLLSPQEAPSNLLSLDTHFLSYSIETSNGIIDNEAVSPLLKDWIAGNRNIYSVRIVYLGFHLSKWSDNFDKLAEIMGATAIEESENDGWHQVDTADSDDEENEGFRKRRKRQTFELRRIDGKILLVGCGKRDQYSGYFFIHEHDQNHCEMCNPRNEDD